MTPHTELDRFFAQAFPEIPKPTPLAPIDPIDADEAVNGICVEGTDDGK